MGEPTHPKYAAGHVINFQAACNQYAADDTDGDRMVLDTRADCEGAVLGSNFMAIFPDFVKQVWAYQKKMAVFTEDVLVCAGRICRGGNDVAWKSQMLYRLDIFSRLLILSAYLNI